MEYLKHCKSCQTDVPLTEFHKAKAARDGLQHRCKLCTKIYQSENSEAVKAHKRKWVEGNKEHLRDYMARWVESKKEPKKGDSR